MNAGTTARGPGSRFERRRHAHTWTRASRTGANVLAMCGASILRTPLGVPFDPEHHLACPSCTRRVRRAR